MVVPGRAGLVLALLLSVSFSGCLADDIWREPFVWRQAHADGARPDQAQAFAHAFSEMADQGFEEGAMVVRTVEDLPDNIIFQNARDFLNSQSAGSGDQADAGLRTVTAAVGDGYVQLTGPAADAWNQGAEQFGAPANPVAFTVPDRTTRLRMSLDVVLTTNADPEGGNPLPFGKLELILRDPAGRERAHYDLDHSRHLEDMFIVGTYGGANAVREHLGGQWSVEVRASGEGVWALIIEAYQPQYDDYEWWQFWRGEKRKVVGE